MKKFTFFVRQILVLTEIGLIPSRNANLLLTVISTKKSIFWKLIYQALSEREVGQHLLDAINRAMDNKQFKMNAESFSLKYKATIRRIRF